jgi:hypothetical protein
MEELFKEVFDSLPHVNTLWVDAKGDYYLHFKKGCEVVTRSKEQVEAVEEKKPKKKK